MNWFVYLLQCADDSLYTGITIDLAQRLKQHNLGKGAKYTASRLPVELVWQETVGDRQAALKREYQLKQLSRAEKLRLVKESA